MLKYFKNKAAIQYLQLLTSTFGVIILQFITQVYFTRYLTTEAYGEYKFYFNLAQFLLVLLVAGIPFTVAYLISDDKEDIGTLRKTMGSGFYILTLIYIFANLALIAVYFSGIGANFYKITSEGVLFIQITFGFILHYYTEYLCIGVNDIKLLSWKKFMNQLLPLILILGLHFLNRNLDLVIIFSSIIVTNLLVQAYTLQKLKADFKPSKSNLYQLISVNNKIGIPVFLGSILSVASFKFVSVLVVAYVSQTEYAVYGLAMTLSLPLSPLISSIGGIFYKKFRDAPNIKRKFSLIIFLSVIGIFITYSIFIYVAVPIIFGEAYIDSIPLAQVLSLGALLFGYGDVYNRFLSAKGEGGSIRNSAIISGLTNLAITFFFIERFTSYAAVFANLLGAIVYVLVLYYYYHRYKKKGGVLNV